MKLIVEPIWIFEIPFLIATVDETVKIQNPTVLLWCNDNHALAESIGRAIVVGHCQSHGKGTTVGIRVTRIG